MKFIQEFVASQFTFSNRDPKTAFSGSIGSVEHLFSLIVRSTFRRSALDPNSSTEIKKKISQQVSEKKPIQFSIPFGAYKSWHIRSCPDPDWAEVFNINYLIRYALPIVEAYEPGVLIQYSYTDEIMDTVSNMPLDNQRHYIAAFQKLLSLFERQIPGNLRLRMVRLNDFYSDDGYRAELNANFEFNKTNWESKYSKTVREYKIESARHNFVVNGIKDMTAVSGQELEDIYLQSAMWCDAVDCLKKRREFNKYSRNIQIVFVRGPSLSIHLGVCETAGMHFWVGSGVVENRRSRCLQRIFSQPKLESIIKAGEVSFVESGITLVAISEQFAQIPVWTSQIQS